MRKFFVLTSVYVCLLMGMSETALGFPKYLEVWFLKPELSAQNAILPELVSPTLRLAQNDVCIPYGSDCFDPQKGVYPNPDKRSSSVSNPVDNGSQTQLKNALESDMINCDKNYYFDMFCGKASKSVVADAAMEVWIDISSSLRELDSSSPDGSRCYRRELVEGLRSKCGDKKIDVIVFDTSFKQVVDLTQTCIARGLNDQKRMVSWLENSQAKSLIFVTDINEETPFFESFLRDHAAVIYENKTFKEMLAQVDKISKSCFTEK